MVQHPRGVFGAKRCLACFSSPDPTFFSEEILNWLGHILQQVLEDELNWYHASSGSDKQHAESASVARVQRKNIPTIHNMFPGVRLPVVVKCILCIWVTNQLCIHSPKDWEVNELLLGWTQHAMVGSGVSRLKLMVADGWTGALILLCILKGMFVSRTN